MSKLQTVTAIDDITLDYDKLKILNLLKNQILSSLPESELILFINDGIN